jgi:hypothetical protein
MAKWTKISIMSKLSYNAAGDELFRGLNWETPGFLVS